MSNQARNTAVASVAALRAPEPFAASPVHEGGYAEDVFTREAMKQYLSKETCAKLLATIDGGQPLDPTVAGEVAHAMRRWPIDRGATHYTPWFLPLTRSTA